MTFIAFGAGSTGPDTADRTGCVFSGDGEYNCQIVYEMGEDLPDDREWWLLQVISWMVEWGPPRDIAFTRHPGERRVRIEFSFDSLDDCRAFIAGEDYDLVVDGELIVDARVENRCQSST
ncbi:hypothetical protein AArcCO_0634 [Halalkaliarchaeum sp. AArc-CO]|uniref:hypothetical protein n=1 Tax=unclassified Halalkaliarchaeum TaxID=2678344 RepID=UPI00217DBACD|nr:MULTISPECIES: hypothetical protein [unclassified Halalkaliarchaeum]MDR5672411.1 hypothetical protein [Halalkaliarchaeum sp. AArc-GB]UWG49956.1 hypothetical protein AArcCO_0634 [Halalkaliarchaeum sp. AArc-CO]